MTVVPEDEPANDAGFELLPKTVIVKSDGFLLPPDTLVVTLRVPNNPGDGIGKGGWNFGRRAATIWTRKNTLVRDWNVLLCGIAIAHHRICKH